MLCKFLLKTNFCSEKFVKKKNQVYMTNLSVYELSRLKNIKENDQKLRELGLLDAINVHPKQKSKKSKNSKNKTIARTNWIVYSSYHNEIIYKISDKRVTKIQKCVEKGFNPFFFSMVNM